MKKPKFAIKSFLFELLIVFIGVYGAFALNQYQQNQREQKIEENYIRSFYSELVKLTADIKASQSLITQKLKELETQPESGSKPALKPINLYFVSEMLITRAGFNDDVFTQLSADLAASLSGGFDHVQYVSRMVDDFNTQCNLHLIANRPISFYDSRGRLKQEFQWYKEGLQLLKQNFDRLATMMNEGAMPATREIVERLD